MKLIVITPARKNEDEIENVIKMFEAGLGILHVRKIHFSTKELEAYIKAIPAHFHNRIVIHSHHKLALKYNLRGFHFTSTHLKRKLRLWWNTKMIYFRKPNLTRSVSYKRVRDVYFTEKISTDYCFLGTMFHNLSGELYAGFYPETVKAVIEKSGKNIVARGGVNEKSIEKAYELGFYGVALYGHIWKGDKPFERYVEFIRFCKEKNIPIE
ncbi:MAG: thiamine phosphate synthase [Bacteroidia bacterium]|nr:thiamine phosphate synthase [Bacteroidia bacterium]